MRREKCRLGLSGKYIRTAPENSPTGQKKRKAKKLVEINPPVFSYSEVKFSRAWRRYSSSLKLTRMWQLAAKIPKSVQGFKTGPMISSTSCYTFLKVNILQNLLEFCHIDTGNTESSLGLLRTPDVLVADFHITLLALTIGNKCIKSDILACCILVC